MKKFFCFLVLGLALAWPFFALVNVDGASIGGANATPGSFSAVTDSAVLFTDNVINNASTGKHGYMPKLSGRLNGWLNGMGANSVGPDDIFLDPAGFPRVPHTYGDMFVANAASTNWLSIPGPTATNYVFKSWRDPGVFGINTNVAWGKIDQTYFSLIDDTSANVTTGHPGLVPKADGNANHVLLGTGSFGNVPGAAGSGNLNNSSVGVATWAIPYFVDDTHVQASNVLINDGINGIETPGLVLADGGLRVGGGSYDNVRAVAHISFVWDPPNMSSQVPYTIDVIVPGIHNGDAVIFTPPVNPAHTGSGNVDYLNWKTAIDEAGGKVRVYVIYQAGGAAVDLTSANYNLTVIHY